MIYSLYLFWKFLEQTNLLEAKRSFYSTLNLENNFEDTQLTKEPLLNTTSIERRFTFDKLLLSYQSKYFIYT